MSRHMQLPEGKRIHIYRSGDAFYKGVSVVVNPKCLKSFDSLLVEATTKVDATWGAVRSIHTPNTGTVVDCLGNLRQHGAYVAAGPMGFVSIPGGYENIGKAGVLRKVTSNSKVIHLRPTQKNDIYNVFMYRNGEAGKAVPFKFSKADFGNWEEALNKLSEKVRLPNGPVKRIYHLTGKILSKPEELVNKGSYVAAGSNELFKKVNYGELSKQEPEVGSGYKGSKYYKDPVKGSQNASQELPTGNNRTNSLGRKGRRKKTGKTKKEKEINGKKEIPSTELLTENENQWTEQEEEEGERDVEERGYEEEEVEGAEEGDDGALTGRGRPTSGARRRAASVTSSKVSTRRARSSRRSQARRSRQDESLEPNADTPEEGHERSYPKHKSSNNSYAIPKQIPESDFSKVDYLSLNGASQQNSPQDSPLTTPTNSKPSSPRDFNYRTQGQYSYPFHETIAEESEGELRSVHADRGPRGDSGLSMYDSGHASLFSDEDRPDSVFRAKQTHSRPRTRAVEVNYDTDDGGIYRSKKRADYSRGALEILDSTDTNIELPVDLMDPVEVQEEVYAT
nr:doublecortin domain-containing protein 2-like [Procambarus clarkii]